MTDSIWLVMDDGDPLKAYISRYKLFTSKEKAVEHAKELGFKDHFGMGISDKIGICTIHRSGDINVSIIRLPIDPS